MSTNKFILIEYNNTAYTNGYSSNIIEIAAHLDKDSIEPTSSLYSLHTEYSYGKRMLNTAILSKYPTLLDSNKNNVPQLWKSEQWAVEFANFIIELTSENSPPHIIEVHPPFNDYSDLDTFAQRFICFENKIRCIYPDTNILIENRSGTIYRGGKFLVSKAADIANLCETIEKYNLSLRIVLDFPQLLTAENINTLKFNADKYNTAIEKIHPYQSLIKGIHIWGKKKSPKGRWVAHCGSLDTYFDNNPNVKQTFLNGVARICDDKIIRFLVPEVNSGQNDLMSIIEDISNI